MIEYTKKLNALIQTLISNRSGFSLLELIIVVLLISLVLTIGFTFYFFSITSFAIGEEQTDVQQNARIVADFISKELRIADVVVIIDEYEGDPGQLDVEDLDDLGVDIAQPEEGYHVYFIFLQGGSVYHQEVDGIDDPIVLVEGISQNVDFDLEFKAGEDQEKTNILNTKISATEKLSGRSYELNTEILALNLDSIDELLEGETGTAIIYQVPAPYPAITRVSLSPQRNIYGEDDKIAATVSTNQVTNDRTVEVAFWKVDHYGVHHEVDKDITIDPEVPKILNDEANFDINLPEDLFFGNYYIVVHVDSVSLSYQRFFFILPVINSFKVEDLPGDPRTKITIETSGLPKDEDTEIRKTMEDDPEGEELFLALVEVVGEDQYEYRDFEFHSSTPSPKVDGSTGKADFLVDLSEYQDYEDIEYIFRIRIGGIDWHDEEYLKANAFLNDLEVRDDENNPLVLDPEFYIETYSYEISVSSGTGSVDVIATLDDLDAFLKINDEEALSGEPKEVDITGLDKIEVQVTAEDGETTKEYTINLIKE